MGGENIADEEPPVAAPSFPPPASPSSVSSPRHESAESTDVQKGFLISDKVPINVLKYKKYPLVIAISPQTPSATDGARPRGISGVGEGMVTEEEASTLYTCVQFQGGDDYFLKNLGINLNPNSTSSNTPALPVATVKYQLAVTANRIYSVQSLYGGKEDGTDECVACLTDAREVALLPCRHLCLCKTCFRQVDKCPICRNNFSSYIFVYE